jgi:hypothetical protein
MAADEILGGLATGDIVSAGVLGSALTVPGSGAPRAMGLVIIPEDIGASGQRTPVVLTAEGSIGSLALTLGVTAASEVEIEGGRPASRQNLVDHIIETVVSGYVFAADEAGEAVLDVVRGETGQRHRVPDARQQFLELIELAGHMPTDGPRCELDGNLLPCEIHG